MVYTDVDMQVFSEENGAMGKKSTKENKNIYQRSREAAALSREAAGEHMVFVSPDRIERRTPTRCWRWSDATGTRS